MNSAIGGDALKLADALLTSKEIAESDLRVELMIKESQNARPYDHIWDMYYDEFEDLEEANNAL